MALRFSRLPGTASGNVLRELPKDSGEDALFLGITTAADQTISLPPGWVKTFEEIEGDERFERWELDEWQ